MNGQAAGPTPCVEEVTGQDLTIIAIHPQGSGSPGGDSVKW